MKAKNYFLGLVALIATTTINAQSFGVDIPSASESPYVSLAGTSNATAMTNGVTFELLGTVSGTRTRGGVTATPISVLEDFVFRDGAGATLTIEITGLSDNTEYTLRSYHLEGNPLFPARVSVELIEVGTGPIAGGAQIVDNNPPTGTATTSTGFVFTTGVNKTYQVVSTAQTNLQNDPAGGVTGGPQTRNRFNGVLIELGNTFSTNTIEANNLNVKVSPNPFQESFKIKLNSQISYTKVIVYDALGREVENQDYEGSDSNITLNGPSGLYFLALYDKGNIIATKKILKQ